MATLQKYQNKKIAIYGMGITGISAYKILNKLGGQLFCWDDNAKTRKKIKRFNFSKFWLNKNVVDNIVISPGIDINRCKIKKYLRNNLDKIITDLDLFFEINKNNLIIAITGTNGKSTTCKIVEKILKTARYKVKTIGNIGNPTLTLDNIKKKYIFILEVSSYQLQYSKLFRCKYAAILNISPDHLDRHKNIRNYIKIKSRLFFAQNRSDYSFINSENQYSKYLINIYKSKKLKSKLILVNKFSCHSLLKKINNKHFLSKGNIENLAFAYHIAKKLKISDKIIIKSINKFKGLDHRQEVVFSNKSLKCINDSKATSFDASLQSLSNYDQIYWIVGGLPKRKDSFNLRNVKNRIVKAYIIGKNIPFFVRQINNNIPFSVSENIKNAINHIYKEIKLNKNPDRTILLSPAAASYDQFANFEDRGNYFKSLVKNKFKKINV